MTGWISSHFLQALGWAILNSFWQMALLWVLYLGVTHLFPLSSSRKYSFSVAAVAAGFAWFGFTFFYYLQESPAPALVFFDSLVRENTGMLRIVLLSASLTYLGLLVFPSYRLYRNWKFVQAIKKHGLHKTDLSYRLFVQKVAAQLGISKKVLIYASDLVKSPVTIGYLKPVILVPFAALNHLSTQQVEAILLHELSHIRRFDYLVNFLVSIIHTILYFNPFVRLFTKNIEQERENCCDELVLQFGYDKVSYASALLTLEKLSAQHHVLALCARGKNYLLNRIEKIVGMEKKKGFRLNHLAGLLAALFCIVALNSVLIIRQKQSHQLTSAYENFGNAFNFFHPGYENGPASASTQPVQLAEANHESTPVCEQPVPEETTEAVADAPLPPPVVEEPLPYRYDHMFVQVAQDDVDASLTKEEKEKVKSTVDATKKILTTLQWKALDNTIADAMTEAEKVHAKEEFLKLFEESNELKNLEQQLKAQYGKLDWDHINSNMNKALTLITLDSLEKVYTTALVQLEKAKAEAHAKGKITIIPLPDQSVDHMEQSAEVLRKKVQCIKAARTPKRVIRL